MQAKQGLKLRAVKAMWLPTGDFMWKEEVVASSQVGTFRGNTKDVLHGIPHPTSNP